MITGGVIDKSLGLQPVDVLVFMFKERWFALPEAVVNDTL